MKWAYLRGHSWAQEIKDFHQPRMALPFTRLSLLLMVFQLCFFKFYNCIHIVIFLLIQIFTWYKRYCHSVLWFSNLFWSNRALSANKMCCDGLVCLAIKSRIWVALESEFISLHALYTLCSTENSWGMARNCVHFSEPSWKLLLGTLISFPSKTNIQLLTYHR